MPTITFTKSYRCSDGTMHPDLSGAQVHELALIMSDGSTDAWIKAEEYAKALIANSNKVLDVLTLRKDSRPKARAINGGSKRKKETAANGAVVPLPALRETKPVSPELC